MVVLLHSVDGSVAIVQIAVLLALKLMPMLRVLLRRQPVSTGIAPWLSSRLRVTAWSPARGRSGCGCAPRGRASRRAAPAAGTGRGIKPRVCRAVCTARGMLSGGPSPGVVEAGGVGGPADCLARFSCCVGACALFLA